MSISHADLIKKLEVAAKDALGTNAVSSEKRSEAEEVLLSFRRSKPGFEVCRNILENSSVDTVQYQAASAFKDAIIREWPGLNKEMQNSLQQFILHFILNNRTLSSFVQGILTQILAIMIKMTTIGTRQVEHRQSLYQCLTELISSGDNGKQVLACSILSALCVEFSITNKSSNVGIPWEQHGRSKKQFEEYDLKVIFDLLLNVLRHIDTLDASNTMFQSSNSLCEKFLWIAEHIFNWSFSPPLLTRRSLLVQADNERVLFKPHADWKNILLDVSNIHLFFSIHHKCRTSQNICRLSISCLAQFASLQGPAVQSREAKCHFLKHFVQEVLSLYGNAQLLEDEAMGVANMCKNIVESHKLEVWASDPEMQNLYHQFICCVTRLTCAAIQGSIKEDAYTEDPLYTEAFEILLDMWTTISESNGSKDIIVPSAMQIVESYIHAHICAPEGCRTILDDSDIDIDELEEEDGERFCGQLMSISCLGRLSPQSSLNILSMLIEKRTDVLFQQLHSVQQQKNIPDSTLMQNLFEDLHWLVLISGHMLADDIDGETPLIPTEIIQCSISAKHQVDQTLSLRLLGSPSQSISTITADKQHVDPVIRIFAAMLRLCEIIAEALKSRMFQCLSPQLAQDMMWLLRTWCRPYLLFKEEFYKEISPTMSAAFGPDSEGGRWTVSYIVKIACIVVTNWTFETKLLESTTEMLNALAENDKRCSIIASCPEFWKLGQDICNGDPLYDKISALVRHQLMSSLVTAGTSNMNMYREVFWDQTMNLIKQRYGNLISNFQENSTDDRCRYSILSILDLLQGIAEASTSENSSLIFNFLSGFLETSNKIMHIFRNEQIVVVSVLELFVEVSHKQVCYLHESKCKLLYEWILSVLKTFSMNTIHKRDKDVEEDSFHDLSLIIELLTHLLTKDFIDFGETDAELHAEVIIRPQGNEVSVADVVFYGLGIILPHINTELLSYPSLCSQYFKLVTFLCEIYPEKVEQLPHDVLNGLLFSVQLGLHSYGNDNCKLCLEALLALTDQCCGKDGPPTVLHSALVPFIKLVFDVVLVHASDMELMRTAGETFYSMYIFNRKIIMDLLSTVVNNQPDVEYRQRLINEFSKLSQGHQDEWKPDRKDKTKFIKLLEEIVFNVREILCVK